MDLMLLRVFQNQVLLQCDFALIAAEDLNEALKQADVTRTFSAIQGMLTATANISKALWGQGGRLEAQRRELRDSIGVLDNSSLQDVNMRNNFEHFDDRLDRWHEKSARHNFADMNIGPSSAIAGLDDIDMFRMFDPRTTDLVFWGERFNLQELIDGTKRIHPTVRREAARPHTG